MATIKKSISVTEQQDAWIKSQIKMGRFGNESEVIRDLIRSRQAQERETPEEIEAIRAALRSAEESIREHGLSKKSVDEIWEEARRSHRISND